MGIREAGVQRCEERHKKRQKIRSAAAQRVCDWSAHDAEHGGEDDAQNVWPD